MKLGRSPHSVPQSKHDAQLCLTTKLAKNSLSQMGVSAIQHFGGPGFSMVVYNDAVFFKKRILLLIVQRG